MMNHSGRSHALLSASGASRWLACPPSALEESKVKDRGSDAAAEGTIAHEVAELVTRLGMKDITKRKYNAEIKKLEQEKLWGKEMIDFAEGYRDFIFEEACEKDSQIVLEERLDFSAFVPEGFGTGDCIVLQGGTLTIIDYKYGKGVRVEARNNPQMKLYALGATLAYDFAYEFDKVKMVIYQPRLDHISEWALPVEDLLSWANGELKETALLASRGEGEHTPGSHCRFCKVASSCEALEQKATEMAMAEFDVEDLGLDHLGKALERIDHTEIWIKAVKNQAMKLALEGEKIPGFKLVEGRSRRKYSDEGVVSKVLTSNGYKEADIFEEPKLLGLTAMTKFLGKKTFEDLVGGHCIKPEGKPALVPESDKRDEISTINDFQEED